MKNIEDFKTCELVAELKRREGVKDFSIEPYDKYSVSTENTGINDTGPATILVVID